MFQYISDKVHALGLQIGIYGDMGTHTCGYYPGSMGFEKVVAEMSASWDIDMLKYDGCYSNETQQEVRPNFNNLSECFTLNRHFAFSLAV